jgi:hypothetical protein
MKPDLLQSARRCLPRDAWPMDYFNPKPLLLASSAQGIVIVPNEQLSKASEY